MMRSLSSILNVLGSNPSFCFLFLLSPPVQFGWGSVLESSFNPLLIAVAGIEPWSFLSSSAPTKKFIGN
jgi:hypothetical protein